jgi:PAS domain S-box-containing protein
MGDPVRILHVDDEARFTGLTATHLEQADERYVVETAASADEGLSVLEEQTVDCIVSDYDMPGRNGIEFLQAVRETHPDLPFVLFTGKGSEQVASEAISAGVTDYLQKKTGTEQFELLHNRIENAVTQYRAESELEQHRSVLETLIENLPAGILVEDESREVLAANASLAEMFGENGSPEEFVGADCERLADELKSVFRRSEEFVTTIDDHLEAREPVRGEEFVLTDGRIIERDYLPYELPKGKANLWMYTDVTDARETEQLLTGLFEESLDGIAVHDIVTDEAGEPVDYVFRRVNERFEELTDLDADEIVDQCATEVIDAVEQTEFIERFGKVALGGGPERFEQYSEPLDRHYEVTVFSPKPGRFITLFSDVSERKEREAELEQFQFFIEHTPDLIFVLGEDFSVQYQSPISPAVDYEPRIVTKSDPVQHVHPDDREKAIEGFQQAMASPDEVVTTEFRAEDADGEWRWFETRTQNFLGTEPIDGVLVTVREATDRKEKEQQLRRQNQRLEEFANVVSHDLRNPLSVARGRLELLVDGCESDHIDEIEWALDRMDDLIDDVLTLARQGDTVGETDRVALDELVSQCWSAVATTETTLTSETTMEIRADRSRLAQLLENLFRNSVEHGSTNSRSQTDDPVEHGSTSPDSQARQDSVEHGSTNSRSQGDDAQSVTIRVGELPDGFYVEDTGRGIRERERETVFEAGYSATEDGTGFGLAIVDRIVSAHGWEIEATESEAGGARFEITGVERVD